MADVATVTPVVQIPDDEDRVITRIVVVFAMQAEAQPLIDHLGLQPVVPTPFPVGAPFRLYQGSHDGVTVSVVQPGSDPVHNVDNVGTVPSAIAAYAAIDKLNPDLIINAGTAGGLKAKGAAIGDIYIASELAHHDRRIAFPGFDKYGIGCVKGHETPNMIKALGLKEGGVSTGNSLDCPPQDMDYIISNNATVKDMEGASIAWVASLFEVPFIALKAVTDIIDGGRPTHEEFLENLHSAAASLQRTLPLVVTFCSGKKLGKL